MTLPVGPRRAAGLLLVRLPVDRGRRDDDGHPDPAVLHRSSSATSSAGWRARSRADGWRAARSPIDPLGRLMLAFDGFELSPAASSGASRARRPPGSRCSATSTSRTPGQVRALTDALQARRPASTRRGPAAPDRGRPGGRPAPRARRRRDAVRRATWRSARPATRTWPSGSGGRSGSELRAMGVNVVYAPVVRPRDEPGQPAPRDPLVRRRPGGGRAAGAAALVRGPPSSRRRRDGQALPGPRRGRPSTPTTRWPVIDARPGPARRARSWCRSGRRSTPAPTSSCPRTSRSRRSPATRRCPRRCRATVMHDLLRGELGFRGLTITDALDMGALPQGDAQVDRRDRGAPRRRRPAAVLGRARGAGADRGRGSRTPPRAGCSTPAELRASAARLARPAAAAGRRSPSRRSRSSGRRRTQALAREVAERSITLVRDDDGPAAAPPRAGRPDRSPSSRGRATSRRPTRRRRSRPASPPRSATPPRDGRRGRRRRRVGRGDRRGRARPSSGARPRRAGDDRGLAPTRPGRAVRGAPRDRAAGGHRRAADAVRPRGLPARRRPTSPLRRSSRPRSRPSRPPCSASGRSAAASPPRSPASTLSGTAWPAADDRQEA